MNKELEEKCMRLLNSHDKEIKNDERFYSLKELCLKEYQNDSLIVPIGKISNDENVYMDMTEVSGLFIGGATGTGKSIFIDDLIVSLMLKNSCDEVKFVFLEPWSGELGEYNGMKYLFNHSKKSLTSVKDAKGILENILNLMNERTNKLISDRFSNIKNYNNKNNDVWPHIFVFVDEGVNIIKNVDIQTIFEKILECGEPLGIHLVYATNSYLKDYTSFINKFKYKMTFDLSSEEQEKYIDIKSSHLLKSGESLIKGQDNVVYKLQTPYVSNKEIQNVILEIGKK